MADVTVKKRGNVFQYKFEIASVDGKRKFKNKSGFATRSEAKQAGIIAYNEYLNTGHSFKPKTMSYSDYLDYWMKQHCEVNLKYHTIEAYKNIIKNHIKPRLGFYRLCQITTATIQEFMNNTYIEYGFSKNFMKNILKVLKTSFSYATDVVGFIKENPALKAKIPKYDVPEEDPAHIFTKEEVDTILNRFTKNHCVYYAFLTAYHTGLRGKSRSEKLATISQYFSQGYYITAEVKGATPGNQHWVAVTGIDSVNVMMVDLASSQTIMWNAYEVSTTSQFNYFKTN